MASTAPANMAPEHSEKANSASHRQIALVLEELAQEVETLGAALCGDMDVAMRHMDSLQAIDLIAQKQRSLARLLHADCLESEVEQIGLDILRDRMRMMR